ncbi:hypothetical protein H2248_011430 [Termitomyces sp. 'cryptogamus']|nr:hypothetical protein H2248_011430 [Termitomyces sp. 'cryptogamus']
MTPPPAPVSIEPPMQSATLLAKELKNLMAQLLDRVSPSPLSNLLIAAIGMATLLLGPFVPPITAVGINGASLTTPLFLRMHFPDANSAVLATIITHDFKTADLHKLDPTNQDQETMYTFNGATDQFKVSHCAGREYKMPFSVLIPLQTYFHILVFHVNDAAATEMFWADTEQLLELVAEYKWSAVFAYHLVFSNHCHAEMAASDYLQWGCRDSDLLSKHVYMH